MDEVTEETIMRTVEEPVAAQPTFRDELKLLINKHSMENGSDTPDFILAEYLAAQLDLFDICVAGRDAWYGRTTNFVYQDPVG